MECIKISPDIYRIDDCCIVYAIIDDNDAVLIDFGSGKALDCLKELGINNISAVFITVPQRNHCQGLHLLPENVPLYFPDGTRELIASRRPEAGNPIVNDSFPEVYELRDIFSIQTGRCEFMADSLSNPPAYKRPFQNWPGIKIDMQLKDGQSFSWNEYNLTAYEFPGQTNFHSGYYSKIDGEKVFFTGDNFYPTQQWGGTGGLSSLNGADLINC